MSPRPRRSHAATNAAPCRRFKPDHACRAHGRLAHPPRPRYSDVPLVVKAIRNVAPAPSASNEREQGDRSRSRWQIRGWSRRASVVSAIARADGVDHEPHRTGRPRCCVARRRCRRCRHQRTFLTAEHRRRAPVGGCARSAAAARDRAGTRAPSSSRSSNRSDKTRGALCASWHAGVERPEAPAAGRAARGLGHTVSTADLHAGGVADLARRLADGDVLAVVHAEQRDRVQRGAGRKRTRVFRAARNRVAGWCGEEQADDRRASTRQVWHRDGSRWTTRALRSGEPTRAARAHSDGEPSGGARSLAKSAMLRDVGALVLARRRSTTARPVPSRTRARRRGLPR